ncbi:vWA domain-containing protein [Tengunoibacter tsumagoiensis]|uniref:VWFA domain-containing protein n=1 Tax=Tengunoibacter tsumagoiensis TaxID=2014871 RepID=A0A402A2N4_9CHLR|nr:BatA and WFA domain-containing protein [Tengunoibacter tsumagoiensis]GCE13407.1 hypothetical protein KTT_32660 [Tengunoibacter tsumagoiensis]
MNLLVPAALAFSAIIPIILLFYFMRPKRQERVIGSTLLWQQAMQDLQASRPWQRLRITPLLLLQLLAAVFIVLVLTRPAIFSPSPISGNTIIILQASASMQATDVAPNRFEDAKRSVTNLIDAIGPGDHISLVTMAHTPHILAAQLQDRGQLLAALQQARVTNQDADLEQAISLAGSMTLGQSGSQILVIGDGHVNTGNQTISSPIPVRYITVGTDAPNVAFQALSARTLQGKLVALAQVANYSHQQRSIPVELYGNTDQSSKLLGVKTITLAPGASSSIQWNDIPATTRFLHARLVSQDAFMVDHEAWAIVGSSLRGKVLLVTKENSYLQAALRLQPNVDLFQITPDKYSSTMSYDLTVFDGFVPPTLPNGNIFVVGPPKGDYLFGKAGDTTGITHLNPGNDTLKLLADVDLSTTHVRSSHLLQPSVWAQSIVVAQETPVLVAGENDNRRIAALGFDLHESDIALQPAFPILIHNLINWFLPPPVSGDGQISSGQTVTMQTWPGADQVTITNPDHQTTKVGPPFPVDPYEKTNAMGIYTVTQQVHGHQLTGAFTVNLFNAVQSRLAPAHALPIQHSTTMTTDSNPITHQLREIWPWIAALLLLILCFEWWLFSRTYAQTASTKNGKTGATRQLAGLERPTQVHKLLAQFQKQWRIRSEEAQRRTRKLRKRLKGRLHRPAKGERNVHV